METEVLKSYFEKTCTATEAAMVEEWLMNPSNQEAFNQFLNTYWNEHTRVQQPVAAVKPVVKSLRRYMPRIAAVAAVLVATVFAVYLFSGKNGKPGSEYKTVVSVAADTKPISLEVASDSEKMASILKETGPKKTKIRQNGKKNYPGSTTMSAPAEVQDTATPPVQQHRIVLPMAMSKYMFNDSLFNKLSKEEQVAVINKMALKVNFNNASFREVAVMLQTKYGIILELCDNAASRKIKEYTGRYSTITLPDLMQDMAAQMSFSYTVEKNVIKICTN